MFKTERMTAHKKGKREYLNDAETKDFTAKLNNYFERHVEIPRIKVGAWKTIETLINEEALLFAKYLRNEKKEWIPRPSTGTVSWHSESDGLPGDKR